MKAVTSRSHSWPLCYLIHVLEPIYYFPIFLSNIPRANSQHWFLRCLVAPPQPTTHHFFSSFVWSIFFSLPAVAPSCPQLPYMIWSPRASWDSHKGNPALGSLEGWVLLQTCRAFSKLFLLRKTPSYQEALQEKLRELSQYSFRWQVRLSPHKRGVECWRRILIDFHLSSEWRGDCALELTCVRAMAFSPQKSGISGLISFQVDDGV